MKSIHNSDAFNKLSKEKKDRILEAAITEFADFGYEKANINTIAKKAGISVGAIYKYFNNKQNLYLAIVDLSVEKLKTVLNEIISGEDNLLITIEKIINAIQLFSKSEVYLTKLYNEMTSENNSELVWKTAYNMEGVTANLYSSMIKKAQDNGEVRKDVNPDYFAFFLDNLFILLQFSYSCEYYKERFKMFIGDRGFDDDKLLAGELLKFIKGALCLK